MSKPFRQGDVLLVPVTDMPTKFPGGEVPRENGQVILAYGEATGHHHGIADQSAILMSFKLNPNLEERYLKLPEPVTLRQFSSNPGELEGVDLHGPIELPAGNYRVVIQRHFEQNQIRTVVD